jgi:CMP-2-keto-3-deoxyoctulosonic acid synthetase
MIIPVLTEEDIRRIFREELSRVSLVQSAAPAEEDEDSEITTEEAMQILMVSERTMANYRSRAVIPFRKIGPHRVVYPKKAILEFKARNTRPSRNPFNKNK